MRRWMILAAVACGAAVPGASAHLVYTDGTYTQTPICVGGTSAIAEGPPQVLVDVWTQSSYNGICLTAKTMPAGYLALKRQIWRWTGSAWKLCAGSGWIYNARSTSYMHNARQWAGGMPCGRGWYANLAYGRAYHQGIWRGGSRWSGNHYFS